MRELIEPILHKGQKDREMILVLEKMDEKIDKRLELLEMAVYKMKTKGGKTKFDEIADRFLEAEITSRNFKENLQDQIRNFTAKINDYVFQIDQKLIQISNYKT